MLLHFFHVSTSIDLTRLINNSWTQVILIQNSIVFLDFTFISSSSKLESTYPSSKLKYITLLSMPISSSFYSPLSSHPPYINQYSSFIRLSSSLHNMNSTIGLNDIAVFTNIQSECCLLKRWLHLSLTKES